MTAPIRELGWPSRIFMAVVGIFLAWLGINMPVRAGIADLPFMHAGECSPGYLKPMLSSVVMLLLAAEMFTGHATVWASKALRAGVDRVTRK